MSQSLPERIDRKHPLLTKQYAVFTPPIADMIDQIGDWIDQQVPGAYVFGASRLGKTRGVRWFLESVLEERFHEIMPLIIWTRRPSSEHSEGAFWHELLRASKFMFAEPGKHAKRGVGFQLCLERFIAIANNAGKNHVILLIDEAHDVKLQEWKWLTGLQNKLDDEGYLLSVFSVGTHQLGYQHEYLASTGNAHVAARFMTANARFYGLRSEDETRYVLNGYDEDSDWPPGSGISFLQYFAPLEFQAGHRLSDCGASLWKAMTELTPNKEIRHQQFPMQPVARVIENVLFRLANDESWESATQYKTLLEELTKANFAGLMRVILTKG